MGKYDDIIDTVWPRISPRPRMPMSQRAKIFLPFAALTGYEKLIAEERTYTEDKSVLDSDRINHINDVLLQINERLKNNEGCPVSVTFYVRYDFKAGGIYEQKEGTVNAIDSHKRNISFYENDAASVKVIGFDDIYEIKLK